MKGQLYSRLGGTVLSRPTAGHVLTIPRCSAVGIARDNLARYVY